MEKESESMEALRDNCLGLSWTGDKPVTVDISTEEVIRDIFYV